MRRDRRITRVRAETSLAGLCATLAIVTAVWPDWIEAIGLDPDQGDGTAEWFVVAVFGVLAAVAALLARRAHRRLEVNAARPVTGQ